MKVYHNGKLLIDPTANSPDTAIKIEHILANVAEVRWIPDEQIGHPENDVVYGIWT